jgi:hypothetical protein
MDDKKLLSFSGGQIAFDNRPGYHNRLNELRGAVSRASGQVRWIMERADGDDP